MMNKNLMVLFLLVISASSFGQKLESDGIAVHLKNFAIEKQEFPIFGKQKVITGNFIIRNGKKKVALHNFIIPLKKEIISHIAVQDENGQKIFPRLHFITEENAFTFYEGTDKEGKEIAQNSDSQKEIVLSGLLIWAKLIYTK